MDRDRTEKSQAGSYFAGRSEKLFGRVFGTTDASAGHPAEAGDGGRAQARIATLEDRMADVERRLAELEARANRAER